ncbi:SRPBCC family protein [Rhodococcus sp. IEGM 1366]|uniref:SRPBCC family protein n=1 Tax=Rhodococcus sp. IEGM 1366 TaxID=3082223 RepID=UPI002953B01A|nr:SRPBCC family protein [Rhodococcus sp. IEGM 1366]MDV8066626.1 SRPBCC family protein [Rhodococcus sp. IEGM 1366]
MVAEAVDSLPLVTRRLSGGSGDEGETRSLHMSRELAAPITTLWSAIADLDRIPQWFMPVSGDARLGGRYQLDGNAGGEILACTAPHTLKITWEYGGDVSYVTIKLIETSSGETLFDFDHTADVDPDSWSEYGPGAVGVGWDMGLLGLAQHVEQGTNTPLETPEWSASDEAKAFMAASSELWADAAIASGDDPAQARAAAARATAAYTG